MNKPKVNQKTILAYGLLLPAFIMCAVFIVYPVIVTLLNSFRPGATMSMSRNRELEFSLSVYKDVITDPVIWTTFGRSFVYLFGSLFPSYFLASIMFLWMGDATYGIFNYLLKSVGLIDAYKAWFFDEELVMFSVILPTIWKGYPFFTITLLAALQSIPLDLYEAAEVDGCNSVRKFWHITRPEILEASVLALILNGLWSFKQFDIIYSTTKGGPGVATTTIAIEIYNEAFRYFDICKASVEGIIALAMCAIVVRIFYPLMTREGK